MDDLTGFRVAILITDGFEQVEMTDPRQALDAAGAETRIVSPRVGEVRGWKFIESGDAFRVDVALDDAHSYDFDALLLPGGTMSPDRLRMMPDAVAFVTAFFDEDKPVAAICHGPWMVIEAGAARGKRIAAWPSIKTDLRNAGAEYVADQAVVLDGNLVTSRKPDDIPQFNRAMIRLFATRAKSLQTERSAET